MINLSPHSKGSTTISMPLRVDCSEVLGVVGGEMEWSGLLERSDPLWLRYYLEVPEGRATLTFLEWMGGTT